MKCRDRHREATQIASDLIERYQSVVTIKHRVLETLCHDWRCVLLEPHDKLHNCLTVAFAASFQILEQQNLPDKIIDTDVRCRAATLGGGNGPVHIAPVLLSHLFAGHIRSINRKTSNYLKQRGTLGRQREVACVAIGLGNTVEIIGEYVQFAGKRRTHDKFFAFIKQIVEVELGTSIAMVDTVQFPLCRSEDKQPVNQISKIVAGRAMHLPVLRQAFVTCQDLLSHQINWWIFRA